MKNTDDEKQAEKEIAELKKEIVELEAKSPLLRKLNARIHEIIMEEAKQRRSKPAVKKSRRKRK